MSHYIRPIIDTRVGLELKHLLIGYWKNENTLTGDEVDRRLRKYSPGGLFSLDLLQQPEGVPLGKGKTLRTSSISDESGSEQYRFYVDKKSKRRRLAFFEP